MLRKSSHNSHFSRVFFNRRHLVPLLYLCYEPKFIKRMITNYDCFAYETMFWLFSAENYMVGVAKLVLCMSRIW